MTMLPKAESGIELRQHSRLHRHERLVYVSICIAVTEVTTEFGEATGIMLHEYSKEASNVFCSISVGLELLF